MKLVILFTAMLLQTATLKQNDLDGLAGKHWAGTLTYLDYTSSRLTAIPTELTVKAIGNGAYEWHTAYPKEPSHNSTDTLVISADGKLLDGEAVTQRSLKNGMLKIVTLKTGEDNNKPADFRFTYLIGNRSFSRKKEVMYNGTTDWFTRNTLKLVVK